MIEVKNLSFSYGKQDVLKDICFEAEAGECVGILGNNGVGKSTLITCINRIRIPTAGEVFIDGIPVTKMRRGELARNVAYVPQKNEMSHITVFDSVLLGRKPYIKLGVTQADLDLCADMIERVGLSELQLRNVDELSGGEAQRVMLARALVQQPKVLLLDEPTSNLDPRNQYEMLSLVTRIAKEQGITVLIVIHDLNLALRYCDKFYFIKGGRGFCYGSDDIVSRETVETVYGISAQVLNVNGRKIVIVD